MAAQPITVTVESTNQGTWNAEIENTFEPGIHTMMITTDDGEQTEVSFAVPDVLPVDGEELEVALIAVAQQPEPIVIEKVETTVPTSVFYGGLLLLLIIVIVLGNTLRLAKKAESADKKKYFRGAAIFSILILIISIIIGVYANKKAKEAETEEITKDQEIQTVEEKGKIVDVSGKVISPVDQTGVNVVGLVAGETAIQTSESGEFKFTQVEDKEGIRMTHPELQRAIRKIIEEDGEMDIYFDPDMYNTLIEIVNLEARGRFREIYNDYLAENIKDKILVTDYTDDYMTIFAPEDATAQELVVSNVKLYEEYVVEEYDLQFNKVVEIEVLKDGLKATYQLGYINNAWKLLYQEI